MRFLALALAAITVGAPIALAQEIKTVAISEAQAAQLLIANNRLEDAKKLLQHMLTNRPDDSETLFLLGMVAVAQKDYDTAISLFRSILVREPEAERVRLELARAFFLKGDYDNADRQFRFARAGEVPNATKTNIDSYLSAINRLRQWRFDFSFSLAPDTNQNAATAASQISVFGLPFILDPDARKQSGIGLASTVGGEWSPMLSDTVKARIGADAYRVEYSGGQFDDMTVSAYGGPQFLLCGWNISALATGFQRWYGNQDYLSGVGGKLVADIGITSNLLISASVGGQSITNRFITDQGGPLYSAQAQASYVLTPSSLLQLQLGFNRQDAKIAPYSYSGLWIGGGYQQDLPLGFSAGFQPAYFVTRYDDKLAAFGKTRSDDAIMLGFSLLNRRFNYHGFTPRLSYVFTEQHSNISLYSYTRNQFQIGLTSQF